MRPLSIREPPLTGWYGGGVLPPALVTVILCEYKFRCQQTKRRAKAYYKIPMLLEILLDRLLNNNERPAQS